jgi:hypothetical protein
MADAFHNIPVLEIVKQAKHSLRKSMALPTIENSSKRGI